MSSATYCAKSHKPERRTGGWLLAFAATEFTASADQTLRSNRKRQNNANGIAQLVPRSQGSVAQDSDAEDLQRALQHVASGLAKSGNTEEALSLLGSLRREFPLNAHYHAAAANLLAKQGYIGAARQLASEAAALDPGEPGYVQVCRKSHVDSALLTMVNWEDVSHR